MRRLERMALTVAGAASASTCQAGVLDQIPSLGAIWALTVFTSVASILALRFAWWLALVTLPFPALYFISLIRVVQSADAGPEIQAQAGDLYVFSAYAGAAVVLLAHAWGLHHGIRVRASRSGRTR